MICTFPPSDFPNQISPQLKSNLHKWRPKSHAQLRANLKKSQRCPVRPKPNQDDVQVTNLLDLESDELIREWFNRLRKNSVFQRVVLRDGLYCHWCGKPCNPLQSPNTDDYPTEEHLIRVKDGGAEDNGKHCRCVQTMQYQSQAKYMIPLPDHPWLAFVLGSLATHRLSLLVSKESGPARLFRKLRRSAPPKSATREGLSCQLCLAVHFGALVAGWYWWREIILGMDFPIWWLGMSSGAVCLHMQFTTEIGKE